MATIFYPTGGAFSALTPQIVTASYLTPSQSANQWDALNTTRTIAFTPSDAGNAEGAMLCLNIATNSALQSVTAVLQEWSGGAWVNRATSTITADVLVGAHGYNSGSQCWVYFEFAAPYAVTAVAATWRLSVSATANTLRWRKNGANYGYALVLTTATAYAASDSILFCNGQTFTLDQSITLTTGITGVNTHLVWSNPPVASYTLAGTALYLSLDTRIEIGSSASPVPYAQRAIWNCPLQTCDNYDGGQNHEFAWYGAKPTAYYTKLAANAASGQPVIVTADDMSASWVAGETVVLFGLRGYEQKTISTVVGTTVTFSANLTNNLWSGWFVVNWTRAVVQSGINVACANLFRGTGVNVPVVCHVEGVYISGTGWGWNVGSYATYDSARLTPFVFDTLIVVANASLFLSQANYAGALVSGTSFSNMFLLGSAWGSDFLTISMPAGATSALTNIAVASNHSAGQTLSLYNSNLTDVQGSGANNSASYRPFSLTLVSCTVTRMLAYAGAYGLYLAAVNTEFVDCKLDAAGTAAVLPSGNIIDATFTNCDFGQRVANTADFADALYLVRMILANCSAFAVAGSKVDDLLDSSYIKAHTFNRTANDHRSWWKYGLMQSVGDGLTDTTVRTAGAGKFAIRLEPQSSTNPLEWTFSVPTGDITGLSMTVAVWVKIASATYYAGTHQKPRLTVDYDDGTEAYSDAVASTDWQLVSVTFTPTTSYGQITVTVSGATDAVGANAYFYLDDWAILYPAGYPLRLGGMDLWADALPVTPPISTVFTSEEVWTVPRAVLTGAGTIGKAMSDVYTAVAAYLDATISSRLASSGYTAPDNAGILAAIATAQADLDNPDQYKADVSGLATPGAEMALTGSAIDAIIADMVVALTASGKTPAQALRLVMAALLGVSGGMAEGAPTFADIEGNPAISGTLDDDGNRTAVTLHE